MARHPGRGVQGGFLSQLPTLGSYFHYADPVFPLGFILGFIIRAVDVPRMLETDNSAYVHLGHELDRNKRLTFVV